ncbi:hypothetical protein ACFL1E_06230 [Candidatus Omnitrophota bacterium]
MRKTYIAAVLVLFFLLLVFQALLFRKAKPSFEASESASDLDSCVDDEFGVRFACNTQWQLQIDKNALLIIISSNPAVTLTIARTETPLKFLEQLKKSDLQTLGHYADGFVIERVQVDNKKAFKIKSFSQEFPDIRLLDYYVINDGYLYRLLFSVDPKEKWKEYKPLFKEIIESFRFTTNND